MSFFHPDDERLNFANDMQQYSSRVKVRNWADERLKFERVEPPNYTSVTKNDMVEQGGVLPKETEIRQEVRSKYLGRNHDFTFVHAGQAYQNNNISTYDQDYNQFPKLKIDGIKKRYLKPWQIEQQLETTNLNFTPPSEPTNDSTGRAPGYSSETLASYRPPPPEALVRDDQRYAVPRSLSYDFFGPNKSSRGYPAFAIPEYTGRPPQLHKAQPVAKDLAWNPVLSTRTYTFSETQHKY